ncbi:MAG TPA: sodium:alanine symporter family protein [Gemmatimonadales bacterium]|nr:sodium:alanine symporter family protein [Gemmatimonadales bacterium]
MSEILAQTSKLVWGPPMLVFLVGTGLYLTIRLRFLQFRRLGHAMWLAFVKRRESDAAGDISHFQALMTALAATVGTGNIAGVATAIASGGPGALFWMWVTGLVGMATKFSEAVLAVKFRETDERGEMIGGPMFYLSRGLRHRKLGKALGIVFALFGAVAAFGIGNMVQSNSVADALEASFGVSRVVSGTVMAGLTALVILGGIRSIGRVTSVLVPIMIVFYMAAGLVVLLVNWRGLPDIFLYVLRDAFSPAAPVGGFLGATVREGIQYGVARGVFSNESGLGSAAIAAAAAQTRHPVTQALVSMTQTFIDTLIVCSVTGFVIIATGAWKSGATGAELTTQAFSSGLPGQWGGAIVAVGLALFAYSTILGWAYYGEKCVEFLGGRRWVIRPYRVAWVGAVVVGATVSLQTVWSLADVMNGAMAIPNLVGLVALAGVIVGEVRSWDAGASVT